MMLGDSPIAMLQVHVWGAISRRGKASLCIFEGIMESTFYQSILRDHLLPFVQAAYPEHHRFQQDNDPKHTSRATKKWMEDNGVNWWQTTPESPDLNPIENVWHQMKEHLRRHVKPMNKAELIMLIEGLKQAWRNISIEQCNRYINHLYKVMPKVIELEGAASGY